MQRVLNSEFLTGSVATLHINDYMCVNVSEQLTASGFFNGGRTSLIISQGVL